MSAGSFEAREGPATAGAMGTAEALGSFRGLNCRGETNGLAVGSVRGSEAPTPTSLRGAASSRSCKLRPSLGRPEGFAVHCKGVALTPLGLLEPPLGWAMRVCGCRDPSWACKAPPFTGGAGRDAFSIVPPRAWWVSDPDVPFTRATSLLVAETQCLCLEWSFLHPGTRGLVRAPLLALELGELREGGRRLLAHRLATAIAAFAASWPCCAAPHTP